MSEGIWIGGHYTSEEESQQIAQEYNEWKGGGNVGSGDDGGGGYYDGQMGDPEVSEENQTPSGSDTLAAESDFSNSPEPQPSTNWIVQPENLMEVWNKFDQDPNYEDEHYSREQVENLYDYYSYKNPGLTPDKWSPLMDDDEFVTKEIEKNNWYDPVKDSVGNQTPSGSDSLTPGSDSLLSVYNPGDQEKQAFLQEPSEKGSWESLDWIGKLFSAVTTTDNGIDAPDWTKQTQAGAQALSSAMAGPAALKIVGGIASMAGAGGAAAVLSNPWVLAGTALAVGGLTFYQAVSGKEIPVFNKFLELSDIVDTTVEHSIGFGLQGYQMAKSNIERANADPNDSYGLMAAINDTVKDIGQQASNMWKAGEYTYEMYGSIGDFAIDALKEIFKGEEGTKQGEGWFFNRGLNEKQQLAEGTYGAAGQENIREMFAEMDALGVDKDTQNAIMQQAVINVSGTSGNVSDYVAQMLIDLDILTTPMENKAAGVVSRITGNELGVEAARVNSGSMLTQIPFVGSIYQALSGKKAPGGIMEWMDEYRNLARTKDVSTLTSADRFFGGIDKDGKIRDFARVDRTGMTDLLPESKVAGVGNIANNVMNAYMYDVTDTADIRNRLASLAGDANGTYDSGMNNSADVLTVRDGVKHAIAEVNPEIFIQQYESSEGARTTLFKAAEDLGMEVKDVLSLYSETPAVFEQRVRDYAAQHNGMFAGIDVSAGIDPINTIVQGFTIAKEGKGAPLAWDIRQVQYQVTTSLIDSMAEYYTDYYGIEPNSVTNTVFDTMKSAQSLLLLGWSPSYFINNVINNTVTSAAEGVLGFMTPTQIRTWMDAFGVSPARMDVDANAEFRSQTAEGNAFSNAVSKAKKQGTDQGVQGALTRLNSVLKTANDKLGVFSRLSGLMETTQGNQLTAVAIQQYWGQRWKRGEGFHLMPTALVDVIEQQNPGMTNVIYQAVENGLSMEAISRALFDTYVKPDAGTVMRAVCADLFRGEAAVYEEIFEKSGVMRDLNEKIANCNTDDERQTVLNEARDRIQKYVDNLRREDLIQRANNVATVVEAEGLTPVTHIMSEMEMNHTDFWIRQRKEWTDAYQRIMAENMDSPQSRSLLADLVSRQAKEWADLYKQEVTTIAGVMKGLGFQHESSVKYIGFMNEKNQNWQNFNDAKSRELQRAYERTNALRQAAGKGKVDRVKMSEVWEDFHRNVSELYDQHFAREQEMQSRMDAAFVEGYEFATQKSGEQFRQNFQRISEIRQRMHDMQQDAHEKTSKMSREDKAKFYEEFNPKYNAMIREIGDLGDANARIIDEASSSGPGYENHATPTMTPEQTVQATEVMDTNNAIREKAMRERQGYLDRDGIRQGWIDNGRTPAEADLMMAVYDALAEQWARDNGAYPDEFYSQAVQLKEIASWLPGTEQGFSVRDSSGVLHQVDMIKPADVNTENFQNWFGNSVMVDDEGKPKVFYHGSGNPNITEFDTEAGTYFTDNKHYAERYQNIKRSMGKGEGAVYECYLRIEKPFDTRDPECRRIFEEEFVGKWGSGNITERGLIDWTAGYDLPEFLREKGYDYDGLVLDEGSDGGYGEPVVWRGISYVVLDPNQIKSIYNGGEWSRTDPNILHQTTAEYAAKYHDQIMAHYGNPNFREWFGQSKVVDEYGLPLVVHHGTTAQFKVFSKEKLGEFTNAASAKMGFFFSRKPETAEAYTSPKDRYYSIIDNVTFKNTPLAKEIVNWSIEQIKQLIDSHSDLYDQMLQIGEDLDLDIDYFGAFHEIVNDLYEYEEAIKFETNSNFRGS